MNSLIFFFIETLYIVNEEISFKENAKHITKPQVIEIKFQNMLKEIFTSLRSIELCIKKEKNKQTKYNTADQIVDMQAVNFVLMKLS